MRHIEGKTLFWFTVPLLLAGISCSEGGAPGGGGGEIDHLDDGVAATPLAIDTLVVTKCNLKPT